MATVLPGSPPGFNKENIAGTVKAICGYLRTFHDNVDFQLGQIKKSLESHAKSVEALEKKVQSLENGLGQAEKTIGTLQSNYNSLSARVAALEKQSQG